MAERWTHKRIREVQGFIRKEIGAMSQTHSRRERLDYALKRIRELEDDATSLGMLQRYVYVVSALLLQSVVKVLSRWQVDRLQDLAFAILRAQGIPETNSKLSFLYGDVHQGMSIIYRTNGEQWTAAWEQQIASDLSHKDSPGGKGFRALSRGIRAFRLGHVAVALHNFLTAYGEAKDATTRARARIEQTKLLRLAGETESAAVLASETLSSDALTGEEKSELEWDLFCCRLPLPERIRAVTQAVRRGGSHHEEEYVIEAFFWNRVTSDSGGLTRVPSLKSLAWDPNLQFKSTDLFFKFSQLIENCYKNDTPMNYRMRAVAKMLPKISTLITLDKELFVWAALARWLAREQHYDLATSLLTEYEAISLKLSEGRNPDSLGVLTDLLKKPWFEKRRSSVFQSKTAVELLPIKKAS